MTDLTAEAYAILEGRHSDPFQYLGPHSENGRTVVRAFLPDAQKVDAIAPHGEAAALTRIHDAGLFAGLSIPFGDDASVSTGVSRDANGFSVTSQASKSSQPEPGSYGWRVIDSEATA